MTACTAAALFALGMAPALASCVAGPPVRSPHAFTGVVLSTTSRGRVAVVRTDEGERVDVRATTATAEDAGTSVDRTYEVGGRYEFHPTNDASPFADNSCTATHLLSMASVPPSAPDRQRARTYLAGALVLVGAGTAASLVRRRRSRGPGAAPG